MSWVQGADGEVFVTFGRGLGLTEITALITEYGKTPITASGETSGWAWCVQPAHPRTGHLPYAGPNDLARALTHQDGAETVFLSTWVCDCPAEQRINQQACRNHPIQFAHYREGFETMYFNFGGRESHRGGWHADFLLPQLLAERIVGRDTSRYDADPAFNADGAHTVAIIAEHFALPSPPLALPDRTHR
ncbi:hypothetical protein [Actinomadura macrotermitis]|uniref:Uncharacterized protein n=1 Tax=Actinomadura macrotermitis TaxID=2585200 RepID=A0A7K0BT25_9ACTN|nr:hypothetical protein [Actinomadura macrotermitis]MQY04329.1 hypothetical protein [Actinomadura macrotermitis]